MDNVKVTPQLVETNETADGIQDGETFEVEFLFEDLVTSSDDNPNGVVLSGYTDVLFNPTSVLLADDGITYGDGYTTNQTGDNRLGNNGEQVGRVSEVGAATIDVNAPARQVVFTLTFEAQTDLTLNTVTIDAEKPDEPTNLITIASSDDDQTRNTEYGQETIGPAVNIIESEGSTEVSEDGETDSYELVLNSQPTANVTIEISNIGQVSVEPTSLTFTPENWDTPQEVTVTADDDDFAEGDRTTPINHSVADDSADEYVGVGINNVSANITDNDVDPITGQFNLDVDGDGQVSSLTDGLIIFRHIATNGDTSTYEDNLGSAATVPIEDIASSLNEVTSPQGLLDVDGDDQVSSLTDGLIIFRHIATNGDTSTYEDNLGSGATVSLEDIASSLDSLII